MIDLWLALKDPDIPFLRYALVVGLLASVSLGIIGSYVVTRRITYIAAAISHCVLGGIGAALYLNVAQGLNGCNPMYGAVVAALLSALIIGLVSLYARQREDTVISAVWALGMAIGLVFFAKTPGYVDPMSYLFGDILLISADDVWLVLTMDAVVIVLGLGFYPKFLALCFDEEFAELRGVGVKFYYLLLLCLTALTVVLLVRVVGIVLVIALLTLPAAVAGHFVRRLWQMMAVAVLCCMAFVTTGVAVSYPLNLPSGPVIILVAGTAYLAVALAVRLWTRRRA
jgi:zinc transport system permease protein